MRYTQAHRSPPNTPLRAVALNCNDNNIVRIILTLIQTHNTNLVARHWYNSASSIIKNVQALLLVINGLRANA